MEILGTNSDGHWLATPSKYIAVIDLRNDQKRELNAWGKDQWLQLLHDRSAGFLVNWLLYAATKRDATIKMHHSAEEWRKYSQAQEVEYWKVYLEGHGLRRWE